MVWIVFSTLILPPEVRIRGNYESLKSLAVDIAVEGLRTPLVASCHDAGYLILSGRRRFLALEMLLQEDPFVLHGGECRLASEAYRLIQITVAQ